MTVMVDTAAAVLRKMRRDGFAMATAIVADGARPTPALDAARGRRAFAVSKLIKTFAPPRSTSGGAKRECASRSAARSTSKMRSFVQPEDDVYGGLHFDRDSIQKVGAIAPVADRIDGGFLQHGMTADHMQVLDRPDFGDGRLQYDHAFGARCLGDDRIHGNGLLQKQSFRHD